MGLVKVSEMCTLNCSLTSCTTELTVQKEPGNQPKPMDSAIKKMEVQLFLEGVTENGKTMRKNQTLFHFYFYCPKALIPNWNTKSEKQINRR